MVTDFWRASPKSCEFLQIRYCSLFHISVAQSSVEARKGVAGYRETQDALENVSTMKSDFDQMKGRTLEDISHMVQQLTNKIANKKSALAPIIKELRPLRQEAQVHWDGLLTLNEL